MHTYNPNTQEAKVEKSQVWGQPGQRGEFEVNLSKTRKRKEYRAYYEDDEHYMT
jgi:hypothetical protein